MGQFDKKMNELQYYVVNPDEHIEPQEIDIKDIEDILEASLPADYREFLKKYGGTALKINTTFPIKENTPYGNIGYVDVFHGFSTDVYEDIRGLLDDTYVGRIPDKTLPVASDPYGNQILLSVNPTYDHQILFWDHEFTEFIDTYDMETLITDLKKRGMDTDSMDDHAIILEWAALNANQLDPTVEYINIYRISKTFTEFMNALQPDPDDT